MICLFAAQGLTSAYFVDAFTKLLIMRDMRTSPIYKFFSDFVLDVAKGETTRAIINIPPRHLKSTVATVALVAWVLGHDPSQKIIILSYNKDHALVIAKNQKGTWSQLVQASL